MRGRYARLRRELGSATARPRLGFGLDGYDTGAEGALMLGSGEPRRSTAAVNIAARARRFGYCYPWLSDLF